MDVYMVLVTVATIAIGIVQLVPVFMRHVREDVDLTKAPASHAEVEKRERILYILRIILIAGYIALFSVAAIVLFFIWQFLSMWS